MGYFCRKHIRYKLKKYRRAIFHKLNIDAKFEETLTLWLPKLHEEFGELSLEHITV